MIHVHTSPFVGCDLKVGLFIRAQGVSAAIGMQSVFVPIEETVFLLLLPYWRLKWLSSTPPRTPKDLRDEKSEEEGVSRPKSPFHYQNGAPFHFHPVKTKS